MMFKLVWYYWDINSDTYSIRKCLIIYFLSLTNNGRYLQGKLRKYGVGGLAPW